MATLDTVGDYVAEARALLQDTYTPPRYTDADLISNLNIALSEAYRVRADLFMIGVAFTLPSFTAADLTKPVPMEPGYRPAFTSYMVGRAQLRDQEDTTDPRAGALMQGFKAQLLVSTS
jgi:hypothetical protein